MAAAERLYGLMILLWERVVSVASEIYEQLVEGAGLLLPVAPVFLLLAIDIIPFGFFFTAGPVKHPTSLGFALDEFALSKHFPIVEPSGPRSFLFVVYPCLLYTSPSPRDATLSRMPSSA